MTCVVGDACVRRMHRRKEKSLLLPQTRLKMQRKRKCPPTQARWICSGRSSGFVVFAQNANCANRETRLTVRNNVPQKKIEEFASKRNDKEKSGRKRKLSKDANEQERRNRAKDLHGKHRKLEAGSAAAADDDAEEQRPPKLTTQPPPLSIVEEGDFVVRTVFRACVCLRLGNCVLNPCCRPLAGNTVQRSHRRQRGVAHTWQAWFEDAKAQIHAQAG